MAVTRRRGYLYLCCTTPLTTGPEPVISSIFPTLPLLYSYRRCPYAMRARMALLQAGREFRVFDISLRDKPAELLTLSPKGTVPVLHLPDGRVLEESREIMQWALTPCDRDGWWRRAQSPENLALVHCNDGDFKHQLDRYKYPDRYPEEAKPRDTLRSQAAAILLEPLERTIAAAALAGRRHALRDGPGSFSVRAPVRRGGTALVRRSAMARAAGLAGRVAGQHAICNLHEQTAVRVRRNVSGTGSLICALHLN